MKKQDVIIIHGAQASGKTTLSRYLTKNETKVFGYSLDFSSSSPSVDRIRSLIYRMEELTIECLEGKVSTSVIIEAHGEELDSLLTAISEFRLIELERIVIEVQTTDFTISKHHFEALNLYILKPTNPNL